jgi:hypothetical protein
MSGLPSFSFQARHENASATMSIQIATVSNSLVALGLGAGDILSLVSLGRPDRGKLVDLKLWR